MGVDAVVPEQECESRFALVDDREIRLLMLLPQLMLVVATALAVAIDSGSLAKVLAELGVAAFAGAWMALIYVLRPRWDAHRLGMVGWYCVLLALMAALTLLHPLFGFFTWTGYIWGSLLFPLRWRLLSYLPVAVIAATSPISQ